MTWGKTWTVALRCYHCGERFVLHHVEFPRIAMLRIAAPCPSCGVRARHGSTRVHRLVDLSDELETVYRKPPDDDTWHFSPSCAEWPADEFIELEARPRIGALCHECSAKAKSDEDW